MVAWNSMLLKIIIILLGIEKQHVRFMLNLFTHRWLNFEKSCVQPCNFPFFATNFKFSGND